MAHEAQDQYNAEPLGNIWPAEEPRFNLDALTNRLAEIQEGDLPTPKDVMGLFCQRGILIKSSVTIIESDCEISWVSKHYNDL